MAEAANTNGPNAISTQAAWHRRLRSGIRLTIPFLTTTYLTNNGKPLRFESVERMPLKHLWRYHVRWWSYATTRVLDIDERRKAFTEAHRAAQAVADLTKQYL